MQQNIEFERCIDFLVRMLDKYGDEVLRELEEEKQNKEEKTAQNTSERVWLRMFWVCEEGRHAGILHLLGAEGRKRASGGEVPRASPGI